MLWRWLFPCLCLVGYAVASDIVCQSLGPGERLCTTVHRHFSGAMVVRDWLRDAEPLPSQRVIEGARAGALLIGKASLRRNEKQQWVVSLPGQDGVLLLGPSDTPPRNPCASTRRAMRGRSRCWPSPCPAPHPAWPPRMKSS